MGSARAEAGDTSGGKASAVSTDDFDEDFSVPVFGDEAYVARFTQIGTPYYGRRTLAGVAMARFTQIGTPY